MADLIDISEPITAICHALNLDPWNVARIDFTPTTATATVYKTNADGNKIIDPETVAAATRDVTFQVKT